MVDSTLAQASNAFVYSAMLVYTGALLGFAIDLSGLAAVARRVSPAMAGRTTTSRYPVAVGATHGDLAGAAPAEAGPPAEAAPPRRRAAAIALSLSWLALGLHAGGVISRGLSVHRPPWGNMYEFSVAGALVVTAVFLAVQTRHDVRYLGAFVVGPVLLTLGLAVAVFYTQASQLVPALQSFWLAIHVSVAFVASALFTLAFSITVLQLVQDRRERARAQGSPPKGGRFMDGIPAAADLERSAYRLNAVAFPLWTFTVIAGAIWAEHAWGRYWNWDPKEVWSFVIWVVYAGYLHARATRGWDGRPAAYLAIAGFVCLVINFTAVNILFVGLHSYA